MRRGALLSPAASVERSWRLPLLFLLLVVACAGDRLPAQEEAPPPPANAAPYTLHLYARLVELPTLIVFHDGRKAAALDPQQIDIRLNAAPPFHPTSVRLEGNDPLSIALLVDVSGDESELLSALRKDLPSWAEHSLHANDHLSIFALDCSLYKAFDDAPVDPSAVQRGVDAALTSQLPHGTSNKPACGKSIHMRSFMAYVMRSLSKRPGRHVLLVVSGGRDGESKFSWPQLESEASDDSVTVFGLTRDHPQFEQLKDIHTLARQSGGLLFAPEPRDLPKSLERIVTVLRGRYILQFGMPSLNPVVYRVFVTLPKYDALILPSAIVVPLPNPAIDHPATDLPSEVPEPSPPVAPQ